MSDRQPSWDPCDYLEPDQLRRDRTRPLPRAPLSRAAAAGLWALRVLVLVLGAMVVFTFLHGLGG